MKTAVIYSPSNTRLPDFQARGTGTRGDLIRASVRTTSAGRRLHFNQPPTVDGPEL